MDTKYYNTFGSEIPNNGEAEETAKSADAFHAESINMTEDAAENSETPDTAEEAPQPEAETSAQPEQSSDEQPAPQPTAEPINTINDEKLDALSETVNECRARTADMNGKLELLTAQMNSVNSLMTRLAAYDTAVETLKLSLAANQNAEKNLYNEVEQYKRGAHFTTIRPFLMFLIERVEDLKKSKAQYEAEREQYIADSSEAVLDEFVNLLNVYISSFDSFLKIQGGVEVVAFEPDTPFVPGSQRIIKTVSTDDASKHGLVAQVLSECYMYEGKVLKPASVYAYKK